MCFPKSYHRFSPALLSTYDVSPMDTLLTLQQEQDWLILCLYPSYFPLRYRSHMWNLPGLCSQSHFLYTCNTIENRQHTSFMNRSTNPQQLEKIHLKGCWNGSWICYGPGCVQVPVSRVYLDQPRIASNNFTVQSLWFQLCCLLAKLIEFI